MKKANEKVEGALMEDVESSLVVDGGESDMGKTLASNSFSMAAAAVEDGGESDVGVKSERLEKPAELSDGKRQKRPSTEELNPMFESDQKGENVNKKKKGGCLDAEKIEEDNEHEEKKVQENGGENEKEEKKVQENGEECENEEKKVQENAEENENEEEKVQENGEANEKMKKEEGENEEKRNGDEDGLLGVNVSKEFDDVKERRTRENTPCNLIAADADSAKAPGSGAKHPNEPDDGVENSILRDGPTEEEIKKVFAPLDEERLQRFTEKYNFDFVNEKPLPGRFEWEKVHP